METVRRMVEVGVSIPTAIKEALKAKGLEVGQFAEKYSLPEKSVSNGINANVKPTQGLVDALSAELGGSPFEWRMLLWEAARPEAQTDESGDGAAEPQRQMVGL